MITKIIRQEEIHKASKYIEKGSRFVIVSHVSPDGDSLGSSLGLSHFLGCCGKEQVSVIVPDAFPSFYQWLPGSGEVIVYEEKAELADRLIAEAEVIFCLDFNEPKRIGKMAAAVLAAEGRRVMIDHHPNPADFCRLTMSYPAASSTSELVFRLICRLEMFGLTDKATAECIYTGMMTDTGSFTYNSNKSEIYTIVGELIKKGIDKDDIYRKVYQVYSEDRLRLMGYTLYEKLKLYPDKKTALISLTQEEMDRFNHRQGDTEGFVNLPLSIDGIVFSVFIREGTDCVKLSLRSTGDFPANRFAAEYFSGGGHKNASGGEYHGTLSEAVALFEKALSEFPLLN